MGQKICGFKKFFRPFRGWVNADGSHVLRRGL